MTSAASRAMKSSGSKITWVVPSRQRPADLAGAGLAVGEVGLPIDAVRLAPPAALEEEVALVGDAIDYHLTSVAMRAPSACSG